MCGIAGLISSDPENRIAAMLKSIEHRGRDDEGVWTSDAIDPTGRKVTFGHRRLAIIDTSAAGHQPMISRDGRFVLTFNGEIYNYKELRDELKTKGHKFETEADTEVVIAAYREWREDFLSRLNGMFAFAIWDEKEKSLMLARDRVGIKPLYFANVENNFIFASEAKGILASKLVKAELDKEGLHQFLTFLWTPDPHTLFKNIHKLPPASLLIYRDGQVTQREWWDISFDEVEHDKSEVYWRDKVLETLDRVVGMEMVADVPLGAFLSGGVDSSSIVALMRNHLSGRKVSTYTVGIEQEDLRYDIIPDDVEWARKVNQLLDTDYHESMLRSDVADLLPMLVWHSDAPVIDMAIPSYLISRKARETLTVMLSGMGGDEVFAGYPRQMAMNIASVLDPIPSLIRRPLMRTISGILPGGLPGNMTAPFRNAKKFARSAAMNFEERYLGFGTYFTDEAKEKLYASDLKHEAKTFDAYKFHRRYFEKVKSAAPLNRLLYVDLKTFLPCLNLETTDKTSMAATLEVRVPFLNVEMLELSARIPASLKLRGLRRKYILKRAAEKLLPRDIVWRRKAGFSAPIRSWLRGALKPMVEDLLSEQTIKKRGLFDAEEVRHLIDANLSGREDLNLQVFQLLTLELWMRAFID